MKAIRIVLLLLTSVYLISCTVGPDYRSPVTPYPLPWANPSNSSKINTNKPIDITWWEQFNDPLLNQFIGEAVNHNLDIKIAEARILNARALRQIAVADFFPKVDAKASDLSRRISIRGSQVGFFKNISPELVYLQRRFYNVGFDASWELDFFGQTRRAVEAQNANLCQQIAKRRSVVLTTIAEIARNYFEYRGTQQLINYTRKSIKNQKVNYNMINERFRAGEDNTLNVSLAKSEWTNIQARLPNLVAQLQANAYQLAVLLGRDPQSIMCDLDKPHRQAPYHLKSVAIGLRSDILRRRPDVFVAERALAESVAEIGVAVAEQYPKFVIIGDYQYDSMKLSQLFLSTSRFWIFGPSVSLPIFRGGAIRANIASKKALANAALYEYKSTVLHALQDADTALVRYRQEVKTTARLQASAAAQARTVKFARERYSDGEDDVLALITAEQNLYNAQINMIESRIRTQTDLVSLFKALGGGWEIFEI